MTTVVISRGGAEDIIKILKLMQKSHEEWLSRFPMPIEHQAAHWISNIIAHGLVLNATLGGRLVGTAGFIVSHFPWNQRERNLTSVWLYLADPPISGLRNKLVERAKEFAMKRNMDLFINLPYHMESEDDRDNSARIQSSYLYPYEPPHGS